MAISYRGVGSIPTRSVCAQRKREKIMANLTVEEALRYYAYDYTVEISNGEVVGLSKETEKE